MRARESASTRLTMQTRAQARQTRKVKVYPATFKSTYSAGHMCPFHMDRGSTAICHVYLQKYTRIDTEGAVSMRASSGVHDDVSSYRYFEHSTSKNIILDQGFSKFTFKGPNMNSHHFHRSGKNLCKSFVYITNQHK